LCAALPSSLLRVKGCTRINGENGFVFFERVPDGEVHIKEFYGEPVTGSKLLSIGLGSEPVVLSNAIEVACKS